MDLTPDDVLEAASVARSALEAFADQDWGHAGGRSHLRNSNNRDA
jgi:hypothetical protein